MIALIEIRNIEINCHKMYRVNRYMVILGIDGGQGMRPDSPSLMNDGQYEYPQRPRLKGKTFKLNQYANHLPACFLGQI